ncbi:MAG: hypothetical protein H0X17_12245 [Deltaproteobacteria bacterium]|nr:hypothetical protein [Deltaproteobacteria bacterium]
MRAFRYGLAVVGVVGGSALAPARAEADVVKVFGELHGGAMGGSGQAGDQQDEAFFATAPHGMYGARVGARFLVVDATLQHHQYRGGGELATWTQVMAGLGFQSDLGSDQQKQAHTSTYVDVGLTVGFGLGTGRQVDPPLSNDEVTDKGFLVEGRLGFGKHLNKVLDVGLAVPVSWGYFFKNGVDDTANDVSTQYQSLQIEAVLYLRLNIKLL